MFVAMVDKAIEYQGVGFLSYKKYSSAELSALTLPVRAAIIIKKINKTIIKSTIIYFLSPFPSGVFGVSLIRLLKTSGSEIVFN